MNKEIAVVKLPRSRNVWIIVVVFFSLCFSFYYFYGGYVTLTLVSAVVIGVFYFAQDALLYHPDLPTNSRIYIPIPTMHNLPHESVNIRTPDNITLHAFWVYQPEGKSSSVPTIVYLHGNAGNMGHRMQNVWGIYHYLNCNILMVEYRGYGLSTGAPSEHGLIIDAKAAVDYLYTRDDLDQKQIVLFGRSLGGAVTIDVAADTVFSQKIMCAIVENTFTSIPDMAIELIHPLTRFIPYAFYKNKFNSLFKIRKCSVPFLFISGMADNLVPPRMMRELYNECSSVLKRISVFSGGSHNDTWIVNGYYESIRTFLNECQHIVPPLEKPPEISKIWHEIQEV